MRCIRLPARHLALTASLAAALLLAGCGGKSSTGPTGPPTGTFSELLALIDRSVISGAVLPTDIDTTAAILGALEVEGFRAAVAFFPTFLSPQLVQFSDAGVVSLRTGPSGGETALDKQQLIVSGFTMSIYSTLPSHPAGIALAFDGTTQHRFTVNGSSSVAAFTDSVKSVSKPVITAPAPGATITRASGLTLDWTPMGADTTVYVTGLVVSQVDSTLAAAATIARDVDGSTTISSGRLSGLPPGPARLTLARYRILRRDAGARRINLVSEAVSLRTLELQ